MAAAEFLFTKVFTGNVFSGNLSLGQLKSESELRNLDASIKRNSALVRKLRGGGPVLMLPSPPAASPPTAGGSGNVSGTGGVAALLAECAKLNQAKVGIKPDVRCCGYSACREYGVAPGVGWSGLNGCFAPGHLEASLLWRPQEHA
eukprot:1159500-Pelagomonas_calceolata.AAC.5